MGYLWVICVNICEPSVIHPRSIDNLYKISYIIINRSLKLEVEMKTIICPRPPNWERVSLKCGFCGRKMRRVYNKAVGNLEQEKFLFMCDQCEVSAFVIWVLPEYSSTKRGYLKGEVCQVLSASLKYDKLPEFEVEYR